jgi:hypothetical protein
MTVLGRLISIIWPLFTVNFSSPSPIICPHLPWRASSPIFPLWLKMLFKLQPSGSLSLTQTLCVAPLPMNIINFTWLFSH